MTHYADSSFLVSCYVADIHTSQAKARLSRLTAPLPFTALHALEVRNAFKLGIFRGLLTTTDAAAAWRDVESDLRSGRLATSSVKWAATFRISVQLSEQHSATLGTRSLDILHVAVAKSLRTLEFVSFDTRQRTLASAVGLRVNP